MTTPTPSEAQPVAVVPVPSQHEVVPVEEAPPAENAGQVTIVNQPAAAPTEAESEAK